MTTRFRHEAVIPPVGGRRRRALGFVLAILQLAVAFFAPVLDARAEQRGAGAVAHVESGTGISCVTVHDHEHCLACRVIGTGISPAPNSPPPRIVRDGAPRTTRVDCAAAWVARSLHPPRPPPVATA